MNAVGIMQDAGKTLRRKDIMDHYPGCGSHEPFGDGYRTNPLRRELALATDQIA